MSRESTYLNFSRNTEEAFNFYKSVFGGEFGSGGIARFRDIPSSDDMPPFADDDKNLVMHIELPITGGHYLMGTDAPESMGFKVKLGNITEVIETFDPESINSTELQQSGWQAILDNFKRYAES